MTNVVLYSTMYSPFQVDVADALRCQSKLNYHLIFTTHSGQGRGKHWTAQRRSADFIHQAPSWNHLDALIPWLRRKTEELQPSVAIVGGFGFSPVFRSVHQLRREGRLRQSKVGYWLERPNIARPIARRTINAALHRWQLRTADFLFAIGDMSRSYYERLDRHVHAAVIPYGQDLSHHFGVDRSQRDPHAPVTFLFSGQLVPRNNIRHMCKAFEELARRRPGRFRLIIAASGPEEYHLERAARRCPAFSAALSYDREYETWLDRIRPFRNADVLVCVSHHAGWGLVVPEALAAGMPVLGSTQVGSVRHFVRPEVNGLICNRDPDSIYWALQRFVDHPELLRAMEPEARKSAKQGTAEDVATRLASELERLAHRV